MQTPTISQQIDILLKARKRIQNNQNRYLCVSILIVAAEVLNVRSCTNVKLIIPDFHKYKPFLKWLIGDNEWYDISPKGKLQRLKLLNKLIDKYQKKLKQNYEYN